MRWTGWVGLFAALAGCDEVFDLEYIPPPDASTIESLPAGPFAHYALDGDATDSSGNGRHGNIVGTLQFGTNAVTGQAIDCADMTAHVAIAGLELGNIDVTIVAWVKFSPSTLKRTNTIVSWGVDWTSAATPTQGFGLGYRTLDPGGAALRRLDALVSDDYDGTTGALTSQNGVDLVDDTFHAVAISLSHAPAALSVYADGVQLAYRPVAQLAPLVPGSPVLRLCKGTNDLHDLVGAVDEVLIYDRLLTDQEHSAILAHYGR